METEELSVWPKTYNKRTLLSNFSIDLAQAQQNQWQKSFPKGASLLTYLYRILLCCDSFTDK
jgi:hypothetical protein